MSYVNDIQAGGFDPLRDHRAGTLLEMRHARFAVRIVERMQDGRYRVVDDDGTDTLGDLNCAGFWPKATRPISGWAHAWPAVIARGQVTTQGAGGGTTTTPPSGGRRTTVTPDPHSRTGAGVVVTHSAAGSNSAPQPDGNFYSTQFLPSVAGSGPRSADVAPVRPAGSLPPWDDPAIQPSHFNDNTPTPVRGTPNVVNHWQDAVTPNRANTPGET